MKATEIIFAFGHENVTSTNETTFEITKEACLTKQGDCIIAINATKGSADLCQEFKSAACKNTRIIIIIEADDKVEIVKAWGSPKLTFTHPTDLVIRKSSYTDERTVAVCADKAACNLSRGLVNKLSDPKQNVKITLRVY